MDLFRLWFNVWKLFQSINTFYTLSIGQLIALSLTTSSLSRAVRCSSSMKSRGRSLRVRTLGGVFSDRVSSGVDWIRSRSLGLGNWVSLLSPDKEKFWNEWLMHFLLFSDYTICCDLKAKVDRGLFCSQVPYMILMLIIIWDGPSPEPLIEAYLVSVAITKLFSLISVSWQVCMQ